MENLGHERNYCMLIINGLQLDFKKIFLEPLVNLVNNVPDPAAVLFILIRSPSRFAIGNILRPAFSLRLQGIITLIFRGLTACPSFSTFKSA